MNSIDLLLMQYKSAHDVLKQVMDDVTDDTLHKDPGGTANPVATNYAHVIAAEDYVINVMLKKAETIESTAFKDKTGLSSTYPDMSQSDKFSDWMKNAKIDLAQFKEYANAVIKNTEDYIKSLKPEDLDTKIDIKFLGEQTYAFVLSVFVVWNITAHTGEIAAIKGIHGLKGYPF